MNEQAPICQKCPAMKLCPPQKMAEKLTSRIIRENIPSENAKTRNEFSRIKQELRRYGCPVQEWSRLIKPLKKQIIPNRSDNFNPPITPSSTNLAKLHVTEQIAKADQFRHDTKARTRRSAIRS
jgi:hypothetical protein